MQLRVACQIARSGIGPDDKDMPDTITRTRDPGARALVACRHAGGTREDGVKAALQVALDQATFAAGSEVACACGSIVGVTQSVTGEDSPVSGAWRGKFVVPVQDVQHVEQES